LFIGATSRASAAADSVPPALRDFFLVGVWVAPDEIFTDGFD
jgi:hypothetical protein